MSERLYGFPAKESKDDYINFLESKIRELTGTHGPDGNPDDNSCTDSFDIKFVHFSPEANIFHAKEKPPPVALWEKQLDEFVHVVRSNSQSDNARRPAGIGTPERNRMALKLFLGHPGAAIFHQEGHQLATLPQKLPPRNRSLLERGHQYASFIASCVDDRDFAVRVAGFQRLILFSYSAVIVKSNSTTAVNAMMREYTGKELDDKTLEMYRYGAVWANRCMAALLGKGWGHKSWEAFLFETPSAAQLSRFASNSSTSYQRLVDDLGGCGINAPLWEDGWIPYCIPCIVHYLSGNEISLEEICTILGYEGVLSSVQPIANLFMTSLRWLLAEYHDSAEQPQQAPEAGPVTFVMDAATLQCNFRISNDQVISSRVDKSVLVQHEVFA